MSKVNRIWIVAPMRAHTRTVKAIFENGPIETYLRKTFATKLLELGKLEESFGIVAGTGVGKTVFLRDICQQHFGDKFQYDIVTSEDEATSYTWQCPVVICTTGVAMNYLKAGIIKNDGGDVVIIDEVHQTSEHLELVMALAKYKKIQVSWMSATIDSTVYLDYFGTRQIIECEHVEPGKEATVNCHLFTYQRYGLGINTRKPWVEYFLDDMGNLDKVISGQRGMVVFLPTRAMCEKMARKYDGNSTLHTDFYHGGESADKLYKYMRGEVKKPFIIFMTIAGSSSLNVQGLDWVVIHNEMFTEVVDKYTGVKALEKRALDSNFILQMGGRVHGRVVGGQIDILTEYEVDYHTLKPVVPEFVLAGDLEQVALTCARMEIDLDELDPIGGIDHDRYRQVWLMLVKRGLISRDNKLTDYGQKVEKFPVARIWGEHLAQSSNELLPLVMVCAATSSLYSMLNRDGKYDIDEFIVPCNDLLTKYNIVIHALESFGYIRKNHQDGTSVFGLKREYRSWAIEHGIYYKSVDSTLIAVSSILRALKIPLFRFQEDLPEITPELEANFKQLLIKVDAMELANQRGILREQRSGWSIDTVELSKTSVCRKSGQRLPMYGSVHTIRTQRNGTFHNMEGVFLTMQDLETVFSEPYIHNASCSPYGGVNISWYYPGLGMENLFVVEDNDDRIPDKHLTPELLTSLESSFIDRLAYNQLGDLDDDIERHNQIVIRAIVGTSRYSSISTARDEYSRLILGTGVYTVELAKEKGISLKIPKSRIPEGHAPVQPNGFETGHVNFNGVSEPGNISFRNALSGIFRRSITRIQPMPRPIRPLPTIYPIRHMPSSGSRFNNDFESNTAATPRKKSDKGNARRRKEFKKDMAEPMVETNEPVIPTGKTQARADWLIEQTEMTRAKITAQIAIRDQAMVDYQKAYDGNGITLEHQRAWTNAEKKITQLSEKIDKFENEALEIMEELEA